MLVAAAFCPCPPMLHPDVAGGAALETNHLRSACRGVVSSMVRGVDSVVLVGVAPRTGWYTEGARGTLHGFGLDVVLGRGGGPVELPAALALGAWLLDLAGYEGRVLPFGIAADEDPARCLTLGAGLAERSPRMGLLVMGDGSARRDPKAPGSFDERAEGLDGAIAAALTAVDTDRIGKLDPATCDALMVSGRAPWQIAAGAAGVRPADVDTKLRGTRHYLDAPYGVGYVVVGWHEHG